MVYWIARFVFGLILRLRYRLAAEGLEHVPREGPVLLCPNHIKWWDPVSVACVMNRRVHFMAKGELFRNPLFAFGLRLAGAFPVRRGKADRAAVRHSLRVLQQGKVLGVFPEGTRSRTGVLQKAEPGAAMLALHSRAPVVPMGVVGTYKPGTQVVVKIAPPLSFPEYYGSKGTAERLEQISARIMDSIAALLPESQVKIGPR